MIRLRSRHQRSIILAGGAAVILSAAFALAADTPSPGSADTADLGKLDGRRFNFYRDYPFQTFPDVLIRLPGNWPDPRSISVDDPLRHGMNEASGAHAKTLPSTKDELRIAIENLNSAGDFDLPIRIPGPPARQITIDIHASDGPLFPFLVVCGGVITGLVSRYLTRQRPVQQLHANIARVRARIRRLRDRAIARGAELVEYSRILAEIEIDASYQETGPVQARLDELVKKLDALEAPRAEQRQALRAAVARSLEILAGQRDRWIDPNTAEQAEIDRLVNGLHAVSADIEEDFLDRAHEGLAAWNVAFGDLMRHRARRFLDEIIQRATALSPEERRAVETAVDAVQQQLRFGALWLAEHIAELNDSIAAVELTASGRGLMLPLAEPETGRRTAAAIASAVLAPAAIADADRAAESAAIGRMHRTLLWLTLLSVVVAILTGWPTIYLGKAFGGWADYITAFVWGFGLDAATRSVAAAKLPTST